MKTVRQRIFRKRNLGCIIVPVFVMMLFYFSFCRNCETTFVSESHLQNTGDVYPFLTGNLTLHESTGEQVAQFVEQLDVGCHVNVQTETRTLAEAYSDLAAAYPATQFDTSLDCSIRLTCDDLIDTGSTLLNRVVGCGRDLFFVSSLYMHFLLYEDVLQEVIVEVFHDGFVPIVER